MSSPNDFTFTSSNKEKVALLINRKQGENYHMRPVKTRHTGCSVIVTTAVRAREVYIPRGLRRKRRIECVWARHRDTMFERQTNWQIKIRSSCHPSAVIVGVGGGGGRERRIESVRGRHRGTTSECVCVCVFERGVDRLLSRSMCHPTPSVPGSVCVSVFEREASR